MIDEAQAWLEQRLEEWARWASGCGKAPAKLGFRPNSPEQADTTGGAGGEMVCEREEQVESVVSAMSVTSPLAARTLRLHYGAAPASHDGGRETPKITRYAQRLGITKREYYRQLERARDIVAANLVAQTCAADFAEIRRGS